MAPCKATVDAVLHIIDVDQMNWLGVLAREPLAVREACRSIWGRSLREAQSCGSYPSDDDAMPQMHDRSWPLKFGWDGHRVREAGRGEERRASRRTAQGELIGQQPEAGEKSPIRDPPSDARPDLAVI